VAQIKPDALTPRKSAPARAEEFDIAQHFARDVASQIDIALSTQARLVSLRLGDNFATVKDVTLRAAVEDIIATIRAAFRQCGFSRQRDVKTATNRRRAGASGRAEGPWLSSGIRKHRLQTVRRRWAFVRRCAARSRFGRQRPWRYCFTPAKAAGNRAGARTAPVVTRDAREREADAIAGQVMRAGGMMTGSLTARAVVRR
jgi:hypothetical protein